MIPMEFIADLHVHSKFSRATSKDLDLEHLYIAARQKGITLVGTGDVAHPAWFAEISEKLVPAEPGVFKLKDDIERMCDAAVAPSCRGEVRFILQGEISNIYKKADRTRKNHQVVLLPDLASAEKFNRKLDAVGNIRSDGRPILGLDARDLLEILLDVSPEAMLIPAHIWTPWFSVLGSKSGFDAIEECFEDLTPEIFAAETGLSSDSPMNWRVSALDGLTLVSNSDAHSPFTLGRNANRFNTDLSYPALRSALKTGDPDHCLGTLDLYPEEGKYHYDGHRKCGVRLHPAETRRLDNICPQCGKGLTLGVLYRVAALADHPEGRKPETAPPCRHIIPLPEILSEIFGKGPKTKTVHAPYMTVLNGLGPELDVLLKTPVEEIDRMGIPLLGEAIRRMRAENVHISPGYDGEYGRITLFTDDERDELRGQYSLFGKPKAKAVEKTRVQTEPPLEETVAPTPGGSPKASPKRPKPAQRSSDPTTTGDLTDGLNAQQRQAVLHGGAPLLIVAGPGAGKTRTLTRRIAHLIRHEKVPPDAVLAVTFTNKAAREMAERLERLLPPEAGPPLTTTFHGLCLRLLKEETEGAGSVLDDAGRMVLIREAMRRAAEKGRDIDGSPEAAAAMIREAKQRLLTPDDLPGNGNGEKLNAVGAVYRIYQDLLDRMAAWDFEDLILNVAGKLDRDPDFLSQCRRRFRYVFVDEYQDLNYGQYRLIRRLSPTGEGLCVIGDPDQSIYGFRGSDIRFFERFAADFPESRTIRLNRNYRSVETILEASAQVLRGHAMDGEGSRVYSGLKGIDKLTILEAAAERAEAVAVGKIIERMVGGSGFHAIDFGKTDGGSVDHAFSDFGVLYRTKAQGRIVAEVFDGAGIPYQMASREHVYDQPGIAPLIACLRLTEGVGRLGDLETVSALPRFAIGKTTIDRFRAWFFDSELSLPNALERAATTHAVGLGTVVQQKIRKLATDLSGLKNETAGQPAADRLNRLVQALDLQDTIFENNRRIDAHERLITAAAAYDRDAAAFLDAVALDSDPDVCAANAQKVSLMTLHAAKGLEFPVVFILGCEDGLIPYRRPGGDEVDVDEERRLFYVGMTRAKSQLFLSWSKKRTLYGKTLDRKLSPFVSDIESPLLKNEKQVYRKKKREGQVQLELFEG